MKRALVALALAVSLPALAVERDKKMHAGVSFAVGMAAGFTWPNNKPLAFGVALMPGLLKEISDRSGTGFSSRDMVANAIGAGLGVYSAHWMLKLDQGKTVVAYHTEF